MKILLYNIKGWGRGRIKKQELRGLIDKLCLDFVCIQESKYCDHSMLNLNAICGNDIEVG